MEAPAFRKMLRPFRRIGEQHGVDFGILSEVEKVNVLQKKLFFEKVSSALWTLRGKHLGVLGLSFKGDTDDFASLPRSTCSKC